MNCKFVPYLHVSILISNSTMLPSVAKIPYVRVVKNLHLDSSQIHTNNFNCCSWQRCINVLMELI